MTETTESPKATTEQATEQPSDENTVTTADETTADQPAPAEADDQEQADDDRPQSGREARYRRQLRETEAERDQLRMQLEAVQLEALTKALSTSREVTWSSEDGRSTRRKGLALHDPADVLTPDVVKTLLTDQGTVDQGAVEALLVEIDKTRPHLIKNSVGLRVPTSGRVPEKPTGTGSTWHDAFMPKPRI